MTTKVNGEIIPEQAIEYELGRLLHFYSEHMSEEAIRKQMGLLKEKAREQAIGAKLLIEESSKLDIRVPDEDILEKLNEMVVRCGGRSEFEELLKKQNITEDVVRAGIVQGRRVDLLIDRMSDGLSDPTEQELLEHFRAHAEEYATPPRASAQHILLRMESDEEKDKATARAKLEAIRHEIEQGANFADQAAMHSDCPSGKKAGGSLGWFGPGMMVPEFDKAVFSMAVGELSQVIESPLGFHLIHRTGQEDGAPAEFDEVREKVRDFLRHAMRGEAISGYVAELKEKAVIEES